MADLIEFVRSLIGLDERENADEGTGEMMEDIQLVQTRRRLHRFRTLVENHNRRRSAVTLNFAILLTGLLATMYPTVTVWSRRRSNEWWDSDVMVQFTDDQWSENFRMSRAAFHLLCNQLHPHLVRQITNLRQPVSVMKLVGLTLYRLGTGESFRTISNLFGLGRSTACKGFWQVCRCICRVLMSTYVKRPQGDEVFRMLEIFELKYGFPMCGGAIDGTHIPIIAPRQFHTDYFNRKGWHSILLQGLVNHDGKFIDFDVGQPGKCHDAYVFESSRLYKKLTEGTFYPNYTRRIEGQDTPIVILGDSAYSLTHFLMKPYPEGIANDAQIKFNARLSRARIIVEHAFGRLKGRWRCIMKRNDSCASSIHIVVATCVILHNMCETWQVNDDQVAEDVEQMEQPDHDGIADNNERGEEIRHALTRHFANN